MKQFIKSAFALIIITGFAACNNSADKKEDAKEDSVAKANEPSVVQTTTVDVQLKPSDEHFAMAVEEFSKKNMGASAKHMQEGIDAFKKETASDTGNLKKLADGAITDMQKLDEKIEKGEIKNTSDLESIIYKAELLNTRKMFFAVDDVILPEKEESSKNNFGKAMNKLRTVVAKDKSTAKKKGQELIKKGEAIEQKMKSGAKTSEQEMKEFKNYLNNWLETHI